MGGASPRDALENALGVTSSKNDSNENLSEDVPSIGIYFKDISDNMTCLVAVDEDAPARLVFPEEDTSFQSSIFLSLLFFFPFLRLIHLHFCLADCPRTAPVSESSYGDALPFIVHPASSEKQKLTLDLLAYA